MGSFTNWPDGVTSLGVPIVGSGVPIAPRYWWVSSTTGSAGYDGSYDAPYALLSTAISAATAGDVIVLKASHAETVSAAGGVTVSKAGLQIIGLGWGATRPTFTFSATASTFLISAASVSVSNIVGLGSIDAVVSPFSITAASVTLGLPGAPVEWQDPSSSLQAVRVVLGGTGADNLTINLKVIGIISGGTSPVNAIRLNGTNTATINCDFYGRASTGWIEFITTLSSNVEIYGYMYNSGVTDASKDVINTGGLSNTWFGQFFDGSAGYQVSGGSAAALGSDDVSTIDTKIGTITNTGGTASIGAVLGDFANTTLISKLDVPSADVTANVDLGDVVGNKTDTSNPVIGATSSLMRYLKGLMNSTDRTIVKTDGAVLTGADPIFTIASGPIKIISIVGRVTTIIGGSSNGNIEATTTVPASTTAMSTTVAVDNDAAGTVYTFVGPSGVLTPTTAGVVLMDYGSVTLTPTQYIVNPGTINFTGSAAQSGVIEWTMHYVPMSPSAVVTAAA